ncbi:MAG: sigma-70 family RNA polymerase sigma factor [Symploca sp. SIO2C1]|nr:sigma-70 family RNA polymerase sigma factor [Symploca sp. SIO2C1]
MRQPKMAENSDIVSTFSEFILSFQENSDRIIPIWQAYPKLQRNMQHLLELDTDATEELWARYFLKIFREGVEAKTCCRKDYAQGHLSAYLQTTCYSVALQLGHKHSRVDIFRRVYTYQDYFQKANVLASNPGELLKKFNFAVPSKIKAYAQALLERAVIEQIRRENRHTSGLRFVGWGLLRNTRRRELQAALIGRINQNRVEQHVLIWQCFKEIYVPKTNSGSRHLAPPNNEEFQQIVRCYNQRRLELSEPGETVDESQIAQILEVCTCAVRDWRTVSFSYPDTNRDILGSSTDYGWETIIQDSSDYRANEPLAKLEQQEAWQEINHILAKAFSQLSVDKQNLIRLSRAGLGLTQTEIALVLNLKQYQISRQYKRCQRSLLQYFTQGCSESLNINLSNEVIEQLDVPLQEWLQKHCQEFSTSILESIVPSINSGDRRLLQFYYCQNWSAEQIGRELGIKTSSVKNKLTNLKNMFLNHFTINLATKLEIESKSLAAIADKIAAFVENWLHTIACPLS